MKYLSLLFIIYISASELLSQTYNISGIVNNYAKVTSIDTGACTSSIDIDTTIGFNINEKVLIIQMKGALINLSNDSTFGDIINYQSSGNYEFATIKSISGNTIFFNEKLIRSYDVNSFVQLVSVPIFPNAIVNNVLTASPWNGSKGGILVFEVTNKLTLNSDITVDGLGFRGGNRSPNYHSGCTSLGYYYPLNSGESGNKGEGITNPIASMGAGRGAFANGGGGGNHVNAGGAGGGNYGKGGRGGNEWMDCSQLPIGGEPGNDLNYNNNINKIFLGGGGGGSQMNNGVGTDGSNGGGIIIISADIIENNNFKIRANGLNVPNTATIDGAGGGGAGGTVLLKINQFLNNIIVEAKGGKGGNVNTYRHGPGGGGGGGLVWLSLSSQPSNLNVNVTEGAPGILSSFSGSYGATSGTIGTVLHDLTLPVSLPGTIPVFSMDPGNDTSICSSDSIHLSVNNNYSSFLWSTGDTTSSIWAKNVGIYWVQVNDSNCTAVDTININNLFPASTISMEKAICVGDSIQLFATGGLSYHWEPDQNISNDSISNPYVSPVVTTIYSAIINKDICGSDTLSVKVNVKNLPNIDAGQDTTICKGDTLQLMGSGGISYKWTPGIQILDSNSVNPMIFPASSMKYFLSATDTFGCENFDSIMVNVDTLTFTSFPDSSLCKGDTLQLNISGGNSILWNNAAFLSSDTIFNPLAFPDTTQLFHYIVSSGYCNLKDSVLLNVIEDPITTISNDTLICVGDSIQLFASGGNDYLWISGQNINNDTLPNPTIKPLNSQLYSVIIDKGVCASDTLSVQVNLRQLPNIDAGSDTTICKGDTIQLLASGGIIYKWSPKIAISDTNLVNPLVYPSSSLVYNLIGTDSIGCQNLDSILVNVGDLNFTSTPDTIICKGDTLQLNILGGNSIKWNSSSFLSSDSIFNPLAFPDTTQLFHFNVSSGFCNFKDSILLNVIEDPITTISNDTLICVGDSIQLFASGGNDYLWIIGQNINNDTLPNPIVKPFNSQLYSVIIDKGVCAKDTLSVQIIVNNLPNIDAGPDTTLCIGDTIQLLGSGGINYKWTPNLAISDTNLVNPSVYPQSTLLYYLLGTDSLGCQNLDSVLVNVEVLNFISTPDTSICKGDTLQLNISGGNSIIWNSSSFLSSDSLFTPLAFPDTNTYFYFTLNGTACSIYDSIFIKVEDAPITFINNDTTICPGGSVQLFASGGNSYSWSPSDQLNNSNIQNPISTPLTDITYTVVIKNICSSDTLSTRIKVSTGISLNAMNDTIIYYGDTAKIYTNVTNNFYWYPNSNISCDTCNPAFVSPNETTTYYLYYIDSIGCSYKDSITITLEEKCADIVMPNAFSPNNDGLNDKFNLISNKGTINIEAFRIYNRWGELIFETNDPYIGWDGKYKGVDSDVGVYAYVIVFYCKGTRSMKKGNVTLLR